MQLAPDAYRRACLAIRNHARPIDRALFEYQFGDGSADEVLRELAPFQNGDGGFGRALEPDLRLPDSSAAVTVEAFQYLVAVGAPASSSLVRRGIDYIVGSFDRERGGWPTVPAALADHPHAPWWHAAEPVAKGAGWGNPNAELIACLVAYAELVPPAFLDMLTALARERLQACPDPIASYAARCYRRLAECAPAELGDAILARLRSDAATAVPLDAAAWKVDSFKPFWLVEAPDAPLADVLGAVVERNLDWEISEQSESGAWQPNWTWFDLPFGCSCPQDNREQYAPAWEAAQREWRGRLTLEHLRALRAFGRIEAG